MSSIHDLAALAAEISVNRPEERVGEDYVDGQNNEDDEDDFGGVRISYQYCAYFLSVKGVPFLIIFPFLINFDYSFI